MQPEPTVSDAEKQTTPKGYEIPVPKRDAVMAFFKKVAKPKKG